jgi:hypothetical protein
MYPAWDLSDPFLEILRKHHSLRSAVIIEILILLGAMVASCRHRLLEIRQLTEKVRAVLAKVLPFLCQLLFGLLAYAVSIAVIVLMAVAQQAARTRWPGTADVLFKVISLIAIALGGLIMTFSNSGTKRIWAAVLLGLGMAIGGVNSLSITLD